MADIDAATHSAYAAVAIGDYNLDDYWLAPCAASFSPETETRTDE